MAGILAIGKPVFADAVCDGGTGVSMTGVESAPWSVQIEFGPNGVPLSQPFGASVTICSESGQLPTRIEVDATMPAHKHGMNYDARTTRIDDRKYKVENLLFHMPGVWQLEVTTYKDGTPHRFTRDLTIP
ncbi:MAG: hypothetical protein AAF439_05280 [Pseudomonadota bacterium]